MKSVLITGASGGIGEALCRYFEDRGYLVIAHARNEAKANAVAGNARKAVWGDLTRALDIAQIAGQMAEAAPALDVLVHNAGILSRSLEKGENGLGIQAEVNVVAPAKLTEALLPQLRKADDPLVAVVSSTAANFARSPDYTVLAEPDGSSLFGHYALSKSAANALVLRMSEAFADIRSVATEPGFVNTKMTAGNQSMPWVMSKLAPIVGTTPEKAAHRCFEHVMQASVPSGSVIQNGKVVDSAKKKWSLEEARRALEALLAKAGISFR